MGGRDATVLLDSDGFEPSVRAAATAVPCADCPRQPRPLPPLPPLPPCHACIRTRMPCAAVPESPPLRWPSLCHTHHRLSTTATTATAAARPPPSPPALPPPPPTLPPSLLSSAPLPLPLLPPTARRPCSVQNITLCAGTTLTFVNADHDMPHTLVVTKRSSSARRGGKGEAVVRVEVIHPCVHAVHALMRSCAHSRGGNSEVARAARPRRRGRAWIRVTSLSDVLACRCPLKYAASVACVASGVLLSSHRCPTSCRHPDWSAADPRQGREGAGARGLRAFVHFQTGATVGWCTADVMRHHSHPTAGVMRLWRHLGALSIT